MTFDYDVFFSYRHKPFDEIVTKAIFDMVEGYRLPMQIRRQGYQDIHRAFRDKEELALNRTLTDSIDHALQSSNCLVVVC